MLFFNSGRSRFLISIIIIGLFAFVDLPTVLFASAGKSCYINSDTSLLTLQKKIILPQVKGGFDLMTVDVKNQVLFLSAEDNHTVEVIDILTGKPITSLAGFNEPKWVYYNVGTNRLYISTGGDSMVTELDRKTYKVIKRFTFSSPCNNLRFDSATSHLFVGLGKTSGSLGVIDLKQQKIVGEIKLSGYLKQFEIYGDSVYVNLPFKNVIEVVSLHSLKVIGALPVKEAKENVPMGLDRKNGRLFIACKPGKLVVYSIRTGKMLQSLDIKKDADGISFDSKRNLIYVSCGEGYIETIKQLDADHYRKSGTIITRSGAATSFFSSQLDKYILAVPQSTDQPAEVRIYQPKN